MAVQFHEMSRENFLTQLKLAMLKAGAAVPFQIIPVNNAFSC